MEKLVVWPASDTDSNGSSKGGCAICTTKSELRTAQALARRQAGSYEVERMRSPKLPANGRNRACRRRASGRPIAV